MKTDFASILSGLRHDSGLSQKKAADDLGISQALLSHYENGVREPKLEFIHKACDYYGVTADYILGRAAEKPLEHHNMELSLTNIEQRRCAEASQLILSILADIDDDQLRSAASQYFSYALYVMLSSLRKPVIEYEPLFAAALKASEAAFITNARRVKEKPDYLSKLTDEAIKSKYPALYTAMLEIDHNVESAVSAIREFINPTDRGTVT